MNRSEKTIHLGGTARSPEDVRKLHDLGLRFAEIAITDPVEFSRVVGAYKELKQDLGVYYLCHGPREGDPNDLNSLKEQYLPRIMAILPIMRTLEMALLTIHFWLDPRFVRQETISFKIDLLRLITERAADTGITICVENLSESAAHLEIPFSALPLLCLTLDLGHAELLGEVNTSYGFMEKYFDRIKHVHLHDNRGGQSYKEDLHLPPGEGIIEFEKILRQLLEMGYERTVTLELRPDEVARCLGHVKALLEQT